MSWVTTSDPPCEPAELHRGGVRVALSASLANCTSGEYGDPFSVMGMATRYQHSNFSRGNFGWLAAANSVTATSSGDFVLAPVE